MASDKEKEVKEDQNIEQNEENNAEAGEMVFTERECMVILLNNDNTAYEAVIDVLMNVFQLNHGIALHRMQHANDEGGAICHINTREACEQKVVEAQAYCQARAGMMHPNVQGRSMYYDELEFEVRERN